MDAVVAAAVPQLYDTADGEVSALVSRKYLMAAVLGLVAVAIYVGFFVAVQMGWR